MGAEPYIAVDETGFYVSPSIPEAHCTPYTVAAHLLYENADPFHIVEPSGTIITEGLAMSRSIPGPSEMGALLTITARSENIANKIAKMANPFLL